MARRGEKFSLAEEKFMQRALELAVRGYGGTSPNPMVGAVIVRDGRVLGEGWHERAGEPHAEINAINAALWKGRGVARASIFVTLEPCSTFGRTPPCTRAIIESGIKEVIVAATDPNPKHAGHGFDDLRAAGVKVRNGLLAEQSSRLNEVFNFWITKDRPWVTCKCAMSLDGKIATNTGESKWITGEKARGFGMRLRLGVDAIVAGVNTIVRDDPGLTVRAVPGLKIPPWKQLKRWILDPEARTPLTARVLQDEHRSQTTVVVTEHAPAAKVKAIQKFVRVEVSPPGRAPRQVNLRWLLSLLAAESVSSVLVEGGGETHYNFFRAGLVNRVHFFYAPLVVTGRNAPKAIGGDRTFQKAVQLDQVEWSRLGRDLLCSALVRR